MLASFAQPCQGFPVRDRVPKTGNIGVSPEQNARMELPSGQLDTLNTGAIVAAASPVISQDLEKANPGRPWRALLLNQGIVATRSHDAGLMEQAFAVLTYYLPKDVGQFFTEGMQQMDALNYPEHVRAVMAKYHRQRNIDRSLH